MRLALYISSFYAPFALYDIAKMDDWIVLAEHVIKTQKHEVM